jgi:crotonobetainyl-CoA:carnitine CoA-transferase CaiB-like acyl-CoA transferase
LHRIYEANDGWIAIAAERPGQARLLCEAFRVDSIDAVESAARVRTCAEILEELSARGLPAERVLYGNALNKLFDDPAHRASQLIVSYQHPELGMIEQTGAFWKFSDASLCFKRPPPLLGEHTDEIMAELGYSAQEIQALRSANVIK